FFVVYECDGEDERGGGEDVSGGVVGGDVFLECQHGKADAEAELYATDDGFGDDAREGAEGSGEGEEQHGDADGDACAEEYVAADLLGYDEGGHGFEGLDGHGHAVYEACGYLHDAEDDEHGGGVQSGGEDHGDEQGQVGAYVAEGAGEFASVEANAAVLRCAGGVAL